jgi:hypothetical protein
MLPLPLYPTARERFAACPKDHKRKENENGQEKVRQK